MEEKITRDMLDQVYFERNQLVALLSRLFPAHIADYKEDGEGSDWFLVCIHFPNGVQGSWHVNKREEQYFAHLSKTSSDYDGHTTEQKYTNIRNLELNSLLEFILLYYYD